MKKIEMQRIASSYKDPSGFVFNHENTIYRAINHAYIKDYQMLMNSGLYEELTQKKLLIAHHELDEIEMNLSIEKVIKPIQIQTISYAYEWSFSMMKEAAICTLKCAITALKYGMILKDAPTSNIQFYENKATLIDTLSFEIYEEGKPWIAYRQFCESFLAPLLLMKYCNSSLNKLLIAYPNGIPLNVCSDLLPLKSKTNFNVILHIYLQASFSRNKSKSQKQNSFFSKKKLHTLLQGLLVFVTDLKPKKEATTWDNYYQETIIGGKYLNEKKEMVSLMLSTISFNTLLDLGANEGEFSLLFQNTEKQIIAVDEDKTCIERLFFHCKKNKIKNILPLIIDLTAPSPSVGWVNKERPAFFERAKCDVILSLALIHHLCIAHNLSFEQVFRLFHSIANYVLIEFVEKEDEKVKELLQHRKDIFDDYTLDKFIDSANTYFDIIEQRKGSVQTRTLFLLKKIE
ncbi:MAG: hypothetical protein UZ11_BCD004001623 [Bacteroidetes bacterium OLB11]|nr:MAG: hypothetical protein UZ11_BCD004001623 [Bacteroidetes bacterium OLB11]